ncbi:NDR1/HIN1-like protein 10 [Benincasa hispida]|uniref:NDR1/HIN1-like protein 10 n=1 Tax=Benincasa hispida TaxID=102211 RepID=UPI0019017303|nr:NDR1/HIN1-like protein 10 [Benincasa hispida]
MTRKVQFHVVDADLTQFNFTTNNSQLLFNLNLNMTIKNPNLGFGIWFESIEVAVLYQDINIGNMSLSPFYQGDDQGTRLLKMKLYGQKLVKLNAEQLALLSVEKIAEIFSMKVEVCIQMRVKIGPIRFKIKPKVRCGMNVPLITSRRSFPRFRIIGCYVAY